MSEDHDRCFSTLVLGAFRQVFFNANALRCINIGDGVCVIVYVYALVLVCRGRYGFGGVVLLFILGSNLGRAGPDGGYRKGGDDDAIYLFLQKQLV